MVTTYPAPSDPVSALTRADGTTEAHSEDHGRVIGLNYNIKHYGAKGDGSTNDVVAIQKAITACIAAGGGTVFCPPGTYVLGSGASSSSMVTLGANVRVVGCGRATIFKAATGLTHASQGIFYAPSVSGVEFRDFEIDGNRLNITDLGAPTTNQFGIYVNAASAATDDVVVSGVNVHHTWGIGIRLSSTEATTTATVTTVADSRFITSTAGTAIVVADKWKRFDIAGANHISALTGTPANLISYVVNYSNATHFYSARKARTGAAGLTLTLYTPVAASATVENCEIRNCGSLGLYVLSHQGTSIRNVYSHGNLNDGAGIIHCSGITIDGYHAEANVGHGIAFLNCYSTNVNNMDCRNNTVWGCVFSYGCVDFNASNVVCDSNGGGFDIDVAEATGDNIVQETNANCSNITGNHNYAYHGISVVQGENITFAGVTAIGNLANSGIFLDGRGCSLQAYTLMENANYGINMPDLVTLPASGYHAIGEGVNTGNGTVPIYDGVNTRGTNRYTFPHRTVTLTDAATVAVDASLGDRFILSTAASRAFGAPTNPLYGCTITLETRNTSGGNITPTFNAVYKLVGGAGQTIATNKQQSVTFYYDGTNWNEINRTSGDI